ncbi:MAG: ankyrin repeat domain-containing protein [Myxococcota bacterium]
MLSTVLLLWLAAPPDPVQLALSKRWGELEKALASKKLAAPTSALTSARLIACEAGQHAVADKLAAAGAAGNFYCLASRAQWAELAKESAARRPLTRAQANDERLSSVLPLVVAAKQSALYVDLARLEPETCQSAVATAIKALDVALAKQVVAACPMPTEQLAGWLEVSCAWDSADVVRAWSEFGADLTQRRGGTTCLHRAALRGDEALVRVLLSAGADVNAVSDFAPVVRFPAVPKELHSVAGHALVGGSPEVVKALVDKGADFSKVVALADQVALFPGAAFPAPNNVRTQPRAADDAARPRRLAQVLHPEQRAVLVVGGGTTPEAAQQSLAGLDALKPHLTRFFVLPEGFPRIVKSDDVPGLKPGFHVVLLAAAAEWELQGHFPIVNALRPGSAVRQVSWTPASGPAPLTLTQAYERQSSLSRKVKKSILSMTALWRGGEAEVVATLYDPAGALVTSAEGTVDFGRCSETTCAPVEFTAEGPGFAASGQGEFPACTSPDVRETTARVVLTGEKLEVKARSSLISKGQCD